MKFAMWLLLFSLAGMVVIFGWVIFARPYLIAPVTDKNKDELTDTFLARMYPNGKDALLRDCYYVQFGGRTFKSEGAVMPKGVFAEGMITSYSERPYGVVFTTDKGIIVTQNFTAYKTGCGY